MLCQNASTEISKWIKDVQFKTWEGTWQCVARLALDHSQDIASLGSKSTLSRSGAFWCGRKRQNIFPQMRVLFQIESWRYLLSHCKSRCWSQEGWGARPYFCIAGLVVVNQVFLGTFGRLCRWYRTFSFSSRLHKLAVMDNLLLLETALWFSLRQMLDYKILTTGTSRTIEVNGVWCVLWSSALWSQIHKIEGFFGFEESCAVISVSRLGAMIKAHWSLSCKRRKKSFQKEFTGIRNLMATADLQIFSERWKAEQCVGREWVEGFAWICPSQVWKKKVVHTDRNIFS